MNDFTVPVRNSKEYQKLLAEISPLVKKTEVTGSVALNHEKLKSYWEIGDRLNQYKKFTKSWTISLATDLGVTKTFFSRVTRFRQIWPRGLKKNAYELSWAHHQELLKIHDDDVLAFYIQNSIVQGWSRDSLRRAINKNYFDLVKKGALVLNPQEARAVTVFTYPATLVNAVDGDTLDLSVDVGFNLWLALRVRLRGINCAEMKDGGEAARQFVIEKLKNIKRFMIKTHKTDIYGRYIVDLYYHPELTDRDEVVKYGFCLNDELLKAKLAKPMMV